MKTSAYDRVRRGPEQQFVGNRDGLTTRQQQMVDRSVELVGVMREALDTLLGYDVSIQALAARNAAVTLNNIFGEDFQRYHTIRANGAEMDIEKNDLTFALENMVNALIMLDGQLPTRSALKSTKVEVEHGEEMIRLYHKLLRHLVSLREQRLKMGTNRLDLAMLMLTKFLEFWEEAYPLVK